MCRSGRRHPGRSAGGRALRDRPLRDTQNWAGELGLNELVQLLDMTLAEEPACNSPPTMRNVACWAPRGWSASSVVSGRW